MSFETYNLNSLNIFWSLYNIFKSFNSSRLSKEKLSKLQNKLIREQIDYVYKHSKFYRKKLDSAGVSPSMIKSYNDLIKIPITTKKEVIENYQDIIIDRDMPYRLETTSGYSGLQVKFRRTKQEDFLRCLLSRRYFYSMGLRPFDRMLFVHHGPKFDSFLINALTLLKGYRLKYKDTYKAIDIIEKKRINCIFSAPQTLELIGEEYAKSRTKHLKLVISFAELLSDNRRKKIESLFQVPVLDNYAQKELPLFGFECRNREGFHINSDIVALEVIKSGRQVYDQEGDIIGTDLFNKCAPLIRYVSGDRGFLKSTPCTCGRGFPLLSKVVGRCNDFILTPEGFKISPVEIMCIMYSIDSVLKYRIIQETLDTLEIKIVSAKNYCKADEQLIIDKFKKILPKTIIKIRYVKSLSSEESGKNKFIIQKLNIINFKQGDLYG